MIWGLDAQEGKDDCFCYQHKDQVDSANLQTLPVQQPDQTQEEIEQEIDSEEAEPSIASLGFLPPAYTQGSTHYDLSNMQYKDVLENFKSNDDTFQRETLVQDLILAGKNGDTKREREYLTWAAKLVFLLNGEELRDFVFHLLGSPIYGKRLFDALRAEQIYNEALGKATQANTRVFRLFDRAFGGM
jgi:hypothetical protein